MVRCLLAIGLVIVAVFVLACSSDEAKDGQSVPSVITQNVPATSAPATSTPQPRPATSTLTAVPSAPSGPTAIPPGQPPASATTRPPSSSGSTVMVPFPFENVVQARASLLGTAQFGGAMDSLDSSDPLDLKAYPGWASVYPALRLVGSAVNATPQTVSVYRGLLNSKDPGSASNPKVIAFAVIDTKGACAGGVVRGFPTYNAYDAIEIGASACNAQGVLNVLRR